MSNLRVKWREAFPNEPHSFPYTVGGWNANDHRRKEVDKVRITCRICTSLLIYEKNIFSDSEFRLTSFNPRNCYHKHIDDRDRQSEVW